MLALTPQHTAILEKLLQKGFAFASFPLYTNCIGVKKGNCAALLAPDGDTRLRLFSEASYVVDGQLSVRVKRSAREFYVWKSKELPVTPERDAEVAEFRRELLELLS